MGEMSGKDFMLKLFEAGFTPLVIILTMMNDSKTQSERSTNRNWCKVAVETTRNLTIVMRNGVSMPYCYV